MPTVNVDVASLHQAPELRQAGRGVDRFHLGGGGAAGAANEQEGAIEAIGAVSNERGGGVAGVPGAVPDSSGRDTREVAQNLEPGQAAATTAGGEKRPCGSQDCTQMCALHAKVYGASSLYTRRGRPYRQGALNKQGRRSGATGRARVSCQCLAQSWRPDPGNPSGRSWVAEEEGGMSRRWLRIERIQKVSVAE